MCGIFGYIGEKNKAGEIVFEGLKRLEYRGYDSWGVAVASQKSKVKSPKLFVKKHVGKIGEAREKFPKGEMALGHTRWATHGGVTIANAHPHLDCTGRIALIHNGIIENYDKIKRKLKKLGHKFISETDSEVAVHLIEENLKKNSFREAVRLAFRQFTGLNAIIAMDSLSEGFVAAKTGSPLVVGFGKGGNFLASDASALLPHTRELYFLEDKELVEVKGEKVSLFNFFSGKPLNLKKQKLDWKIEEAELGKFPHFMLKEIFEQPKVLREIAEQRSQEITRIAKIIKKAYGTYMVGCGTAAYAALCGTYLFSRITKKHVNFAVGSEFGYLTDFLTPKSLVIALSQSGETIDIIESIKKAKEKGAKVLAITNVLGSTLYRMADYKLLLNAGPEKCVLSTKSFTSKLAILLLLAEGLSGRFSSGKRKLLKATGEVKKLISSKNLLSIKKLAKQISSWEHIYVIGRGLSYPVAQEASLKIKEASYIHAEGFASGELKHGVIALIEKGTPCLVFAPNDETYGAVLSGAMEIKARGGFIIGVSYKQHEVYDYFIKVGDCGDASSIPNTVVAQLLGYYLALEKGNDPDKPRNLAKSVTVK